MILANFDVHTYQVSSHLTFCFRRRSKNEKILKIRFLIGTILAVFAPQVTPMLPIKFQVNWPFGSLVVKNRFPRCARHSDQFGFPIGTILVIILSTSPDAS